MSRHKSRGPQQESFNIAKMDLAFWFWVITIFVSYCINANGVISIPIQRKSVNQGVAVRKRAFSENLANSLQGQAYFAKSNFLPLFCAEKFLVSLGTPPQPVDLLLDTGSSDIWVDIPTSTFCLDPNSDCELSGGGTYDNTTSSSYKFVNSDFAIEYGAGTGATGDYALETFHFGGTIFPMATELTLDVQVQNVQFGLGINSNQTPAIMGIGFAAGETITQFNLAPYPNLLDQMVSQKVIESRTYSLYLNDVEASAGSILFGGVDLKKFEGPLRTIPMNKDGNAFTNFLVSLTGLSFTPSENHTIPIGPSSSFPLNSLMDSGTPSLILPTPMTHFLVSKFHASLDKDTGLFRLPNCDLQNDTTGYLTLDFSGIKINVPFKELAVPDGNGGCSLGVDDSGSSESCAVLGDTFLRSAYVVVDLVCPSLANLCIW